ncbi:SHOCT domain-containing protein [Streptomyces sp. NPDC085946]|uniref:SHOCT domain-containing protein n=1 Tax=Streptomyces sp. NPDC085946 TaxID=3365744 RepID=UPI0037CF2B69
MNGPTHLAYGRPPLGAFWTMPVFSLWIVWFLLLFRIVADIFCGGILNGRAETGRLVSVVVPFPGVFVRVIPRGEHMGRREARRARARQQAFDDRVRETAGRGPRGVGEPVGLSGIRARGGVTDDEFRGAGEPVLSGSRPPA